MEAGFELDHVWSCMGLLHGQAGREEKHEFENMIRMMKCSPAVLD